MTHACDMGLTLRFMSRPFPNLYVLVSIRSSFAYLRCPPLVSDLDKFLRSAGERGRKRKRGEERRERRNSVRAASDERT